MVQRSTLFALYPRNPTNTTEFHSQPREQSPSPLFSISAMSNLPNAGGLPGIDPSALYAALGPLLVGGLASTVYFFRKV